MLTVIGHKNPDTDSVISAIMFSTFLKKEGKEARAGIAGKINRETEFVLSYFKKDVPETISTSTGDFFLVDHNDLSQSVASKENIKGVLDHHLLAGFNTNETIFFRVEPVGSTATLVYKMMKENKVETDKEEAGLLLAALISDTLNLNSSTTTSEDIDYYYELSEIAGIDASSFAQEMFEAKSDFSGKDVKDIVTEDMKEYSFGNKKVGIGVSETTSLSYFQENKEEILKQVNEVKEGNNFDAFFFAAVNIIDKNAFLYPGGEEEKEVIKKVFNGEDTGEFLKLANISSRKKEIAPPLSEYYEK